MAVMTLESKIERALKQIRTFGDMDEASYRAAAEKVTERVTLAHERALKKPASLPIRKAKPVAERPPQQSRFVESPFKSKIVSSSNMNVKMKHLETGILVTCIVGKETASFIVDRSKLR